MSAMNDAKRQTILHLLLVIGLSVWWESLYVHTGINPLDDSWPIYTIWNLDAGGTLFGDVLWVFPLGHLIPAWIGYHLAPPGLVVARIIYAAFAVAVCAGIYLLGRRLMPPRFALLAGILVAVAAPDSHLMHVVYGYRYMIFSVLALLCFSRRIESGERRWLMIAGLWLGVGAFFRLGPAFAAGCGIGVGVMSMHRDPRLWLRDWTALASGILVIFVPLLLWAAATIGLETLWRELVTRPATMLLLQSLPLPVLDFPETLNRVRIRQWFVATQFRVIWLLYGGYLVALGWHYVRAIREQREFVKPLLVSVWIWGGVFFLRSLTRSDEPHLDSVIPPVLLLAVHGLYSALNRIGLMGGWSGGSRAWMERGVLLAAVTLWVVLLGIDTYVPHARRGGNPVHALDDRIEVSQESQAKLTDLVVRRIKLTPPDARILDLTVSPLYLVLANRRGYPAPDIVMPGTFLTREEELGFIEQVQRNPPALVIWPKKPFDRDPAHGVEVTSPELAAWVRANYEMWGLERRHFLMGPKGHKPLPGW
jgi:hypothetical protein